MKPTACTCLLAVAAAARLSQNDFPQPETRLSSGGFLETSMQLDAYYYKGPISFWTRAVDEMFPSPTIRLKPGDRWNATLINRLLPNAGGEYPVNGFYQPNSTNLHVHGIHISADQDDVFKSVEPGEAHTWEYDITEDHARGVYWYHPHRHGSETLQQSGGFGGALIIDHDEGVRPEIDAMEEVVLFFQHLNFRPDAKYAHHIVSELTLGGDLMKPDPVFSDENRKDYIITNGVFEPTLSLRPQEFKFLRILNGGHEETLEIKAPGCEMWMLAADGVDVETPYVREMFVVVSGSRRDVAIRCPAEGSFELISEPDERNDKLLGEEAHRQDTCLVKLDVSGPAANMIEPQPRGDDWKPYYLQGLMSITPQNIDGRFNVIMSQKPEDPDDEFPVYYINNQAFSEQKDYMHCTVVDYVEEWRIGNTNMMEVHPWHLHSNHFQIFQIFGGPSENFDIQEGEWRDSIAIGPGMSIAVRFRADKFSSEMPSHCHLIAHADLGMMHNSFIVEDPQNPPPECQAEGAFHAKSFDVDWEEWQAEHDAKREQYLASLS